MSLKNVENLIIFYSIEKFINGSFLIKNIRGLMRYFLYIKKEEEGKDRSRWKQC